MPALAPRPFADKRPLPPAPDRARLFDHVTTFDTLFSGWERVAANAGAPGGDGVSVEAFGRDAANRVAQLSHALRAGRYRPGPVRRVAIPKPSGGLRMLSIPCVRDRVVQASAARALMALLEPEMEDASFAYRPGRSVAQAVARVAALRREGYEWVVDADISRYFDHVPHDPLIDLLERHIPDARFVDLVALWLEHGGEAGFGLPQGMPVSPVLANLYLDGLDEAIAARGVRIVRFADDFVLLCKSEQAAAGALKRAGELLGDLGLSLHPEKTRVVPFDQGFRFLGHVFVRSLVWKEVALDDTPREDAVAAAEAATALAPADEPDSDAEPAPGRHAARQRVLHCLEPGRRLSADGRQFVVSDGATEILRLAPAQITRIETAAEVELTAAALDLAAASGVCVLRVDGRGVTQGRFEAIAPARAKLQLAQAAAILDPARRLVIARAIVEARIHNERALVRRLNRKGSDPEIDAIAVKLGRVMRKPRRPGIDVAGVMGHEGEAAALYWPALARFVPAEWKFCGRRARRDGVDPVNIAFDALASMLLRDISVAVGRSGLHGGFAFLHTATDDEDALVYDLAEEFRGPVAEACVIASIGRGALRLEHFARDNLGWRMTREGWKATVRAFEGWVARPIRDPASGDETLWRGLMQRQADRLADAVESGGAYRPYRMDY